MSKIICLFFIVLTTQYVTSSNFDQFYIPTQGDFVAQQASGGGYFHHYHETGHYTSYPPPVLHSPSVLPRPPTISGGWYRPPNNYWPELTAKPTDFRVPTELKPSSTSWEAFYNVPCGTYNVYPQVVANISLSTLPDSFPTYFPYTSYGRKKRSVQYPQFNYGHLPQNYNNNGRSINYAPTIQHSQYFPPRPRPSSLNCAWDFKASGPCKLKFSCRWFQVPALFRCDENFLELRLEESENIPQKFCGSRKPRGTYISNSGHMKLSFHSQSSSLPAALDCTVTCALDRSSSTTGNSVLNSTTSTATNPTVAQPTKGSNQDNKGSRAEDTKMRKPRFSDCKCGVQNGHFSSQARIIGGQPTFPMESSWTVALVRKNSKIPFCSGVLISDRNILTAAHCVTISGARQPRAKPQELLDVLINEHDITKENEIPGGTLRATIDQIIIHPDYNNTTFAYDVAILHLETPIQLHHTSAPKDYNKYFYSSKSTSTNSIYMFPELLDKAIVKEAEMAIPSPICLPLKSAINDTLDDKFALVTGWGITDRGIPSKVMMQTAVKVINQTLCKESYSEKEIHSSNICAGNLEGKFDACVGDSGGPLVMLDSRGRFTLMGLVSWGKNCGEKNLPGVYTRIPGLTEWIQSQTHESTYCT